MDEVKRFVRYILPGWACIIELALALFLSDPSKIIGICSVFKPDKGYEAIGLIIGAFLASGGLGYLFSTIYFVLREIPGFHKLMFIDHRVLFNDNEKIKFFPDSIKWETPDTITKKFATWILKHLTFLPERFRTTFLPQWFRKDFNPKSKKDAWILAYLYWYYQKAKDNKLESLNPAAERLTDILHGLGATLIGSILTLVFWIYLHLMFLPSILIYKSGITFFPSISIYKSRMFWIVFICWLVFIVCILSDFLFTLKKLQAIANSMLIETMMKNKNIVSINQEKSNNDLKIYFTR